MAVSHRLDDGSVVAFSLQQLTEFLQHNGTVGRNSRITSQVTLGNASKGGKQLLSIWVLCE